MMIRLQHTVGVLGLAFLLSALPAAGQTVDSSGSRQVKKQELTDENADGLPDKAQGRGQGARRRKDRFIDKDGDGICDGRAGGLGFRLRAGQDGQGSGKGKMGGGRR
jgi:hypothetical protein